MTLKSSKPKRSHTRKPPRHNPKYRRRPPGKKTPTLTVVAAQVADSFGQRPITEDQDEFGPPQPPFVPEGLKRSTLDLSDQRLNKAITSIGTGLLDDGAYEEIQIGLNTWKCEFGCFTVKTEGNVRITVAPMAGFQYAEGRKPVLILYVPVLK